MKTKILSLLLVVCLVVGLVPVSVLQSNASATGTKAIQAGAAQLEGMSVDSVYFGTYQQSSDGAGGFNVDPIKWDVLANSDGKLFVVSDQALDYREVHTTGSNLDWKQKALRGWLNGTAAGNFYADAFAENEKSAVALTTVTTSGDTNTSDDYVFILSVEEANTYFADKNARVWTVTDYDLSKDDGAYHFDQQWLRNRDTAQGHCGALMVGDGGIVTNAGHNVGYKKQIRPAFNLDTSKVLFTSPAVGGKTGTGLEKVGTYDGNEWKVTLLDSNRSNFTAVIADIDDDTLTVDYTNAVTGTNEFISVIVKDNVSGEYTNYGTVKALANASDANGTVQVDISSIDLTGKTLYVFNEQRNGDKKTDYASALQEIDGNVVKAIEAGATQLAGMSADSVYFGTYQQSSNGEGGFNVDPIKWDVLSNSDGKLFVVSDQALDYRQAHTTGSNLDWKQRLLRTWLNGTTAGNFYADAFAESEKTAVALTTVTTVGDANTSDDYVFILSKEEATTYFADNNARKWTYTDYVKSKEGTVGGHFTHQWLRNRDSSYNYCGVLMTPDGAIIDNVKHGFNYAKQIRPAFNLDTSKVLFTSPAVGGKTGTGLATVGTYAGNEWKVTVLDSSRSDFTAEYAGINGNILTVNYTNAKTGANEYLSAIVKNNATGKYTNYGAVKTLANAFDANGTVQVDISGIDLNGKTLYVFNEQRNGDKKTDYASELQGINGDAVKTIEDGAAQLEGMSADSMYFGTYEQSSNGEGGFNVDPIKWDVLANSEGKLFVVSDQALDYRVAHTSGSNLDWKQRSLRAWLNGTTAGNFYADAFGTNEKTAVALTTVTTVGDTNISDDYVFILSKEEATIYFADNNARKWTYTDYVKSKEGTVGGHFTHQWLRNRDSSYNWCGVLMTPDGAIVDNANHHFGYAKQIRPAFNLDVSQVLFTSPAVGGKAISGDLGLIAVGNYDGNEWKTTLLDANREAFEAKVISIDGTTLTIDYVNAQTGANEYISMLIKDDFTGEYTAYGRVKTLANVSDANGTITLDGSGLDMIGKTLYIFNEQYNGDRMTDYASALVEMVLEPVQKENYTKEEVDALRGVAAPTAPEGYVFSGWYADETLTTPIKKNDVTPEEGAWAKFVDGNLLDVKAQVATETVQDSKEADIRFLTSVNDLNYSEIGFEITIGSNSKLFGSNKVYKKVTVTLKNGATFEKDPYEVFGASAEYFKAYVIQGVPQDEFATEINVRPYWITLDGTTVFGALETKTILQGIEIE